MPVGWFMVPYQQLTRADGRVGRACAMNDFNSQILADPEYAGSEPWSEVEVLGNTAIVKVRASAALLTTINGTAGFDRIPPRFLTLGQTMADLTAGERTNMRNRALALGYTAAEADTEMGGTLALWRGKTVRQFLRFIATRRNDGAPVRSLDDMDSAVA